MCLLNTYSTYWTILIQSLKPEPMLWSESFRKTSTMLLMAQCSGTVKPKGDLAFFGFWQSLLPWDGQLNSLKNISTVSKTVAENTLESPAQHQTEKVLDVWQSVASCGLVLTRTHETTIYMILVIRGWVGAQKPKDNAVTATEEL